MTSKPLGPKELADHAGAIGYLCIYYAELESVLTQLISRMSRVKGETFDLFANQIDLTKKLTVARGLAVSTKAPTDWYTDLDLILVDIQSHIMPKRNRYVHDGWRVTMVDTIVLRRTEKSRVEKPQSYKSPVPDIRRGLLILDDGFHSFQFREPPQLLPQQLRDQMIARRKTPKANSKAARSRSL